LFHRFFLEQIGDGRLNETAKQRPSSSSGFSRCAIASRSLDSFSGSGLGLISTCGCDTRLLDDFSLAIFLAPRSVIALVVSDREVTRTRQ
jgi:hypothetical protein